MATTYTLKRKYFANPQKEDQKKSGVGKKLAVGGALAATAATALAAKGAGGLGKLATNMTKSGGFKNAASQFGTSLKAGTGQTLKSVGNTLRQGGANMARSGEGAFGKVGGFINKAGQKVAGAGKSMLA